MWPRGLCDHNTDNPYLLVNYTFDCFISVELTHRSRYHRPRSVALFIWEAIYICWEDKAVHGFAVYSIGSFSCWFIEPVRGQCVVPFMRSRGKVDSSCFFTIVVKSEPAPLQLFSIERLDHAGGGTTLIFRVRLVSIHKCIGIDFCTISDRYPGVTFI